jgi:hypothetical protein
MFGNNRRPDKAEPNGYRRYVLFVADHDLNIDLVIVGFVSDKKMGFGDQTPDGRPFGMVTAYCQNYVKCRGRMNLRPIRRSSAGFTLQGPAHHPCCDPALAGSQ